MTAEVKVLQEEHIKEVGDNPEKIIYPILVKVINELKNPKNTAHNPYFDSRYTPLPDVLELVKPTLAKYGIAVLQVPQEPKYVKQMVTQRDKKGNTFQVEEEVAIVSLRNSIIHESGAKLDFPLFTAKANSNTPQSIASTLTYLRRYSLTTILGIAGKEEDDDGNYSSYGYDGYEQFAPQQQMPVQTQQVPVQPIQQVPQQQMQQAGTKEQLIAELMEVNQTLEKIAFLTGKPVEELRNNLDKPLRDYRFNDLPQLKAKVANWLKEAEKKYEQQERTQEVQAQQVVNPTEQIERENENSELKQTLLNEVERFIKGKNIELKNVLMTLGIQDIDKASEEKVAQALGSLEKWKQTLLREEPKEETIGAIEANETKVEQPVFDIVDEEETEVFSGILLKKTDDQSIATGEVRTKIIIENHNPIYADTSEMMQKVNLIKEGQKVEAKVKMKGLIPYIVDIKVVD